MKAFILAAGLGTRLGQSTIKKPKALVEVNGRPMLERTIETLKKQGINHFMINIHHFGQQVLDFIEAKNKFGVKIEISDERDELLDTGGAIRKAKHFFDGNEPVLVYNVDVISEVSLKELLESHNKNEALATLCVRKRKSGRGLLFDEDMKLAGWTNINKNEFKWVSSPLTDYKLFAYSGIYLASPDFVNYLPFEGRFSIIDAWLKMAQKNKIIGFHDKSETWFDLGTSQKITEAEKQLKRRID